ncbi:hypothetical protein [Coleofasciculus sp. E1-EBD-02]|uniref:hypothetical protein n=1 Tax=Coleofasciculus sp. E1-EBD-02 TaxID=3068481 RepID=UPI0032F97C3F
MTILTVNLNFSYLVTHELITITAQNNCQKPSSYIHSLYAAWVPDGCGCSWRDK